MKPEIPNTQEKNTQRKEESKSLSEMGPIVAQTRAALLYLLRTNPEDCLRFKKDLENGYEGSCRKDKIRMITDLNSLCKGLDDMLNPHSETLEQQETKRLTLIENLTQVGISNYPNVNTVVDLIMGNSHLEIEQMEIVKEHYRNGNGHKQTKV